MPQEEGVIKYQLHWEEAELPEFDLEAFNHWRGKLVEANLVGKEAGIGFGNISIRHGEDQFIITGTQTGHLDTLNKEHFSLVTKADIDSNTLWAEGLAKPSAESLTHAAVYQSSPGIGAVVHGHHRKLWEYALEHWPKTPDSLEYGTPAMARAVQEIAEQIGTSGHVAMAGHEGGLLAWAANLRQASQLLLDELLPYFRNNVGRK